MSQPVAPWRATYTPGNWVVLAGPTSLVVLQPAPARVSDLLNLFWDDVLKAASIHEISAQIARHNLSQLASFGLVFWDDAGLHTLTRGALRIVNPDTGEQLASGEGIVTWTETALRGSDAILIEMEPVAESVLHLPLIVGGATASSVFLTTKPEALVYSTQAMAADVEQGFSSAPDGDPGPARLDMPADNMGPIPTPIGAPGLAPIPVPAVVPIPGQGAGIPSGPSFGREDSIPDLLGGPELVHPAGDRADLFDEGDGPGGPIPLRSEEEAIHDGDAQLDDGPGPDDAAGVFGDPFGGPLQREADGPGSNPVIQDASNLVPEFAADSAEPGEQQPFDTDPSAPSWHSPASTSFQNAPQGGLVSAVLCSLGHPNPVGAHGCRQCHGPVGDVPRLVARPVLATIRSNFGVSLDLSSPIFIGRAPDTMGDASAQVIKVPSPSTDISRRHLRIAPNEWHVEITDLNSTNGSTVTIPGQHQMKMQPGLDMPVPIGTIIDLGDGVQITIDPPR